MASMHGRDILAKISGQKIRIPDLDQLLSQWETYINPNEDQIKAVVDKILSKYRVSARVNAKLTKNNLSAYVSILYPFADPETLVELTYFVCWMFLVDDEVDQITAPGNYKEAQFNDLWSNVIETVKSSCSISGASKYEENREAKPVELFRIFGESLRQKYTIEQCSRYYNELVATSKGYEVEQQHRDQNKLPEYDIYCKYRYARCCMAQCIALVEFANKLRLPSVIVDSPEMKQFVKGVVTFLWIINDILSLKKELDDNFLENLVIIASTRTFNVQDGLDHCVRRIEETIKTIDESSLALLNKAIDGPDNRLAFHGATKHEVYDQTLKFVTNCKSLCRGIVGWSYETPRYGLSKIPRDDKNSLEFEIKTIGG